MGRSKRAGQAGDDRAGKDGHSAGRHAAGPGAGPTEFAGGEPGINPMDRTGRWRARLGELFYHRDFRRLWIGDAISQFGTMITMLALPLLAVLTLDATPFQVGALTACEMAAFLVIGLPAGAWVDRMRRRNVMIVADVGRAITIGSLPVAAAFGVLTLAHVYIAALAIGTFTVFFDVAYQSYLPTLVGRDHLVEGNAKLQGTQSVAMSAGPGIGGVLIQVLTAPYALVVDAVSYVWSVSWLSAIGHREPVPEKAADRNLRREVTEGLRFILSNRLLRAMAASTALFNLFGNIGQGMIIILLARDLDLAPGVIGLLFTVGSLGGLVGSLLVRRLARVVGEGPLIWLSMALTTPFMLVIPFLQRNWTVGLFALVEMFLMMGNVTYNVSCVSFRQRLCPERLLGRMNASLRFVMWGVIPIGGLIGGGLGSVIGVRPTILVSVIGTMMAILPIVVSPLRTMRELPTEPEGLPDAEPDLAVASAM